MSNFIDSGFRPKPQSTHSWFESLLIRLHFKPSPRQKYLKDVLRVEELLADIAKRCRNNGLCLSIKVDWKNKWISFERADTGNSKSLCHEMSFDELLIDDFNPMEFVAFTLYRKY